MSLSRHLQTSGLLSNIAGMDPDQLRNLVIELGTSWYHRHQEERDTISRNLAAFGLDSSPEVVDAVIHHTVLHYFDKFLPLAGDIPTYAAFLRERINGAEAIAALQKSLGSSRGVCIATAHYGAVEFIVPYLALHRLAMNVVIRFTTGEMSEKAHAQATTMEKSGLFNRINLIEIGKPKTVAAMQMAAVLRRGEVIMSVFDEKTPYSKPVDLFGVSVWGGAGLDRMIDFAAVPSDLYSAFMIRDGERGYRLDLHRIDAEGPARIDGIYRTLQSVVSRHPEQWYFLHEEIPFVKETVH